MDHSKVKVKYSSNVVAIDFGTSYSGYAFNLALSGEKSDPYVRTWKNHQGVDTSKTPTCILFNKDGEFMNFGYDAKTAYMNMTGEESKQNYLFQDFKMVLYDPKLNKDLMIESANGKSMKAMKVFAESLRFLKNDALENINSNTAGIQYYTSDFTWVLTVPAIWSPSAKQFMREAAAEAEIVTEEKEEKLTMALEPESASLWCKKLPAEGFISQKNSRSKLDQSPGTKYIVVDCGGGTIDITVHKILKGGSLKELHRASGNQHGGQTVDRKFKELLKKIFCGVWEECEKNYPSEVQRMMNDFTFLKQVDKDMYISCSYNLIKLAERKKEIEQFFESVNGAFWVNGIMKITKEKLRSFYDESLEGITKSLREVLEKKKIHYILLVGGYAESQILRQHVMDQFGNECKVLCPIRPQEAILRGAIDYGRNPDLVSSRKSAFTYGVKAIVPFNESKHEQERKFTACGKDWCGDVFLTLVQEAEDVRQDETREFRISLIESGEKEMKMKFIKTEKKKPKYSDEEGVEEVGSFNIKLSDLKKDRERIVRLEIKLGSTEISATGTDLISGEKKCIKLNFLST